MLKMQRFGLFLLALSFSFNAFAITYQACSGTPEAKVKVSGYGVTANSCAEFSVLVGNNPAYWTMQDTATGCDVIFVPSGANNGPAAVTRSTTLNCGANAMLVQGACFANAYLSLTAAQQAAIANSGNPPPSGFNTQAGADYACSSGISAAVAGLSPAAITAATNAGGVCGDGLANPTKCAAAGSAAANAAQAGKDAAAAAAAGAAAAAAAGGGGAGQGSGTGAGSASSTPPAPTIPDTIGASGIFYTKGTLTGGKTLSDVVSNFQGQLKNVPIISSLGAFFDFQGSSSCPVISTNLKISTYDMPINIDFLCTSLADNVLSWMGALLLLLAAVQSFRVAFG